MITPITRQHEAMEPGLGCGPVLIGHLSGDGTGAIGDVATVPAVRA
jgi:hypothetical protein